MATDEIKDFIFTETGVPKSRWKRVSKLSVEGAGIEREFKDSLSNRIVKVMEKEGSLNIVSDSENLNSETVKLLHFTDDELKKAKALLTHFFSSPAVSTYNLPNFEADMVGLPGLFRATLVPYLHDDDLSLSAVFEEMKIKRSTPLSSFHSGMGVCLCYANESSQIDDGAEALLIHSLPGWFDTSSVEGMLVIAGYGKDATVGEVIDELHAYGLEIFYDWACKFDGLDWNPFDNAMKQSVEVAAPKAKSAAKVK